MITKRLMYSPVVLMVILLGACASAEPGGLSSLEEARPAPELAPDEVVRTQMRAFQLNNEDNDGIRIAFRFASPVNRQSTGPLPRFIQLMRQPAYRPMLNSRSLTVSAPDTEGVVSRVRVDLQGPDGGAAAYFFYLRRQSTPDCRGCWLTEGVQQAPPSQEQRV